MWIVKFVIDGHYTTAGEATLSDDEYREFVGEQTHWTQGKFGTIGIGNLARYIHDSLNLAKGQFVMLIGEEHYAD